MRRALVVLIAAATSGCSIFQAAVPPPATQQAAAAQPADEARPSRMWDLERETCAELLGASQEDRTVAAMFYYGYVSARAGTRLIDNAQIETRVRRAVDECRASPGTPILQAFTRALVARRPAETPTQTPAAAPARTPTPTAAPAPTPAR
jgi:hypothetical protein